MDSTPPDTLISSGPGEGTTVAASLVTFAFSSTEPNSTFTCSYDGGAFSPCTAPGPGSSGSHAQALADGTHTFAVKARDAAGNTDATAATRTFTVSTVTPPPPDTTPPDTTITKAPPKSVKTKRRATVELQFSANEAASFACSVDGGSFSGCTSPAKFTLKPGKHTLAVVATDSAGNKDASPATAEVNVKKKKKHKKKGGK